MSQNDSGNFEKEFLDSDVDLRIAHPSPGAEIYSRSSGFNLPSFRAIFLFLILIGGAVGSTYFYAFQQGLEEGQRSLPPVVLAEKTPIKVPAENVPGGVPVKPEDLNIYGVMRGAAEPETPQAQPASPADNATGTIESLIARTEDPFEQALNVPKAIADDTRLPAGNSIRVLQNDPSVEVSPPRPDLNRAPRAAVPAARPTAKPAKTQVRPGSVARDDFMVQLAASRSRALARGVYSGLQNNFSDLLGQRNPLILRVDLGDKGIFYRVNVPGFESRNAATAFCANLKSRGQDCLVRKQP
ncbi:SPOR domain-containing protein [Alphaproteobacteria bacterium]|nr:SPOR domain-containing protein [Alphaproteobacteria bacterium]